jgi:hypothetical protein
MLNLTSARSSILCRFAIFLALLWIPKVQAGVTTSWMQTATVLPAGGSEGRIHADIVTSGGGGFNLSPQYRFNAMEHFLDLTAFAVTGTTDFALGARGKYNFLPDLQGQIGLSFLGELSLIRDDGQAGFVFGVGTLGSKDFPVEWGQISPYGSFELELFFVSEDVRIPLTLGLGAQWIFTAVPGWVFYSELGLNLSDSVSRLSFGAAYPF